MKHLTVFIAALLLFAVSHVGCMGDVVDLQLYSTEVAPLTASVWAGGESFGAIVSMAGNPGVRDRVWLLGAGGGVRLGWFMADMVHYKVNEVLWTDELNELYVLRLAARIDAGRVCVIGGVTLNCFVSTISAGGAYNTFSIREGRHGSVMTNWWPGFVAGIQF